MPSFALMVTVRVQPGKGDEFLPLIQRAAAAAAVEHEPDCHAFHVGRDEDDPDAFTFFEVYTNAAALEHHHQQPHFRQFGEEAGHLIVEKGKQRLSL